MGNVGSCEYKQPEPVYVSAVFTGVLTGTDDPQHVPFDRVLTQYPSGAWNPDAFEFVCPKAGVYLFSFSVRPEFEHAAALHLMRGNEPVVSIFADKNDGNAGTSSQSTMMDLKVGERIWIRLDDGHNVGIRSHPKSPSATFNALLVHPDKSA
ncbi:complement C1q tumor necrosis factor-related protein 2-like [Acanthaster planci]|uniref:Complement C1q tumor necrosis factor-related protein 2-like n=1 Tax=Acanthaster planci TaxID=133434 RepID=A0A8B7ZLE2_ACAPL|nr:complement C1q tumor necrosis factor-related protein 2-like [Acanthaster planci]